MKRFIHAIFVALLAICGQQARCGGARVVYKCPAASGKKSLLERTGMHIVTVCTVKSAAGAKQIAVILHSRLPQCGFLAVSDSERDEYGQRIGWTGYTWQKELFPNPSNFLRWVKKENLKTALNLHPASGIQPYEASYKDFVKDYEWSDTTKSVPFHIDEAKWADSYFNTVLGPMEKEGVDFWWLDWQQWKESKFTPGLSNTFWLNHVFFNHAKEKADNERPFIYHRWGGLGSHRYEGPSIISPDA